jgi:hypothetical protein
LLYLILPEWVASRVDLSITPEPDEIVRHRFYIEIVGHEGEHRNNAASLHILAETARFQCFGVEGD